jgi:hypothetical protein
LPWHTCTHRMGVNRHLIGLKNAGGLPSLVQRLPAACPHWFKDCRRSALTGLKIAGGRPHWLTDCRRPALIGSKIAGGLPSLVQRFPAACPYWFKDCRRPALIGSKIAGGLSSLVQRLPAACPHWLTGKPREKRRLKLTSFKNSSLNSVTMVCVGLLASWHKTRERYILVLGLKCSEKGDFHVLCQQTRGKSQVYRVRMRSENNNGI